MFISVRPQASLAGIAALAAATVSSPAHADLVFGLTAQSSLVRFDSASPGTLLTAPLPIAGLAPGESLLGIDFRPATGELYALGSASRVYTLDTASGLATQVGAGSFVVPLNGASFGFDFNPLADRIRITSNARQNLRVHPVTGTVVDRNGNPADGIQPDGDLAYAAGDPNQGALPMIVASAYTNNFPSPPSTVLYDLDIGLQLYAIQAPPNDGVLATQQILNYTLLGETGFDIASSNGAAFVSTQLPDGQTGFFQLAIPGGAGTLIGTIGGGVPVNDIAIVIPGPGSAALLSLGCLAGLRRRRI